MTKKIAIYSLSLLAAACFFSCAAMPRAHEEESLAAENLPPFSPLTAPEGIPERVPEKPLPPLPENIEGRGLANADDLAGFLTENNPGADPLFAQDLAGYYIEEAEREGVNSDIAFAQMCLETGFLRYGNLVQPEMNNFCGLGAIGPEQPGESFPDPRTGVRAHIQHLKAYATEEPLVGELVDPRYRWVRKGSSPTIEGLAGSWAADRRYAEKIRSALERLYRYSFSGGDPNPGNLALKDPPVIVP